MQFRNCATVGGSIYGRFGFSDVLTLFAALDSYVELYHAGMMPVGQFIDQKYDNDILVAIHVKKVPLKVTYLSQRNTATDFPVLAVAVSEYPGKLRISIGARPVKAAIKDYDLSVTADEDSFIRQIQDDFTFGSNRRGSAKYRSHIAGVLVKRALASNNILTFGGNA